MEAAEQVSVAEAKRRLSELLGCVAYGGKTIEITRRGRPVARLVPIEADVSAPFQGWKGVLPDEDPFFDAMESIVAARSQHSPRAMQGQE